jgi:hypothetical protein
VRRALVPIVAALALLAGAVPAVAATPPPLPRNDAFYRYTAADGPPLAQLAPGTVLKHRDVALGIGTTASPVTATQLLYRTSDEQGRPSATVTTIAMRPGAAALPAAAHVVAYLSFYDSLSDKCDPSYTLRGGDPGANNTQLTEVEQALVAQYVASGYITTVPDFEGEGLHWTAGHEAGYGTLDALRATESFLNLPATTPTALSGYSGGSIAADWASELAPTYAHELNIVGVAEGGIPVDFAHNLTYIEGSKTWSGIIPAVLVALSRAYGIDVTTYASAQGLALTRTVQDQCIGDFSGTTPGLTSDQLLKPQYRPLLAQPAFADIVNKLIMGTAPGHPAGPLLMAVGNDPNNSGAGPNDAGQGDDIMVTKDVEALAHEYCGQGVPLQYQVIPNSTHEQAAVVFEGMASAFIAQRFAGVPFADNCSTVGPGNDISPISLRSVSPSPSTSAAPGASAGSTPGAHAVSSRSLASTGPWALAPVVGLLLVAAAGGLGRRRRRA